MTDQPSPRADEGYPGPSTIAGVVLAGGKSRRLGQDKALLHFDRPTTLIAATVERLRPMVAEVIVVADDGQRLGELPARIVPDAFRGAGSLGGIYSGIVAARQEHVLVVACDMPFLSVPLLAHMLARPRDYDVLLPRRAGGQLEPLHAIYSQACAEPIRRRIEAGQYRIVGFLDEVKARYLEEAEIRRFDPDLRSFFNVNTPDELEQALRLLQG